MLRLKGFSLVEMMMAMGLLVVIFGIGSAMFSSTLSYWVIEDARSDLQQKLNVALEKMSLELQESGFDSTGAIQVTMFDDTGTSGTDILRFVVPICLCGSSIIDSNGNVRTWGAPSNWGQSGCVETWAVDGNGDVTVCHVATSTSTTVDPNAVKSHLSHGDYIGSCGACDTSAYSNRLIEYRLNAGAVFVRRVLDQNQAQVSAQSFIDEVTGFQVVIDAAESMVTLNLTLVRTLRSGRQITVSGGLDVTLRNGG